MSISRMEFLRLTGIDEDSLKIWVDEEWLVVQETESESPFTETDLARAHLISDLISDLGVNHEGVGIVLHLVDQIHDLRRALLNQMASGSVAGNTSDEE